ncbi:nucleotidyltransferase domain-containing protein [archaeon]|nr:nucleotidyltransferase domain-containing protein [archaeon]
MKNETVTAIAYCYDLLTFAFQNKELAEKTNEIYLFGSSVRGELDKGSDIDVFFDCDEKDEEDINKMANSGVIKFEQSKDFEKWKLLKFKYPFSIQTGNLKTWELKTSIASEGILLYSKKKILEEGERKTIFTIKYPKKKKEYIKIKRLLFGRTEEEYAGKGLIQSIKGKKISSNVFIIPKEEQPKMKDRLVKEKIDFSMKDLIVLD